MKYSLVILTHNAQEWIELLARSIKQFTVQPAECIFVDSASSDQSVDMLKKNFPHARILAQPTNVDFCKGYNIGIAAAKEEFILMMNQRAIAKPDAAEKLCQRIGEDDRLAAVGPVLLRQDGKVDSLGIAASSERQFTNIAEGDDVVPENVGEPFGVSGATMLLRRSAVDDIIKGGGGGDEEFFDEDFVAYKDDVDVAYRFRLRGWNIAVEPSAIVEYDRNTTSGMGRAQRSRRVKVNSLRNHWFVLLKNERFSAILPQVFHIGFYEAMKLTYVALREPRTFLAVIPAYFRKLPRMLKKRSAILGSATHDISSWFS